MTPQAVLKQFYKNINRIGRWLVRLLIKELKDQGHNLTGSLVSSVIAEVAEILRETEIALSHKKYGVFLNKGVSPNRVPFSGVKRRQQGSRSTTKKSKYIEALIEWIKKAKFTSGLDKDIIGTAFAIAKKQRKYGNPIPYRYLSKKGKRVSKNKRRRGWIDWTLKTYGGDLEIQIIEAERVMVYDYMEAVIFQLVKKNKKIISITRA